MKICVEPSDDSMRDRVHGLRILSMWRKLGFNRSAFINLMQHYCHEDDLPKPPYLTSYWNGQVANEQINKEAERVYNIIAKE